MCKAVHFSNVRLDLIILTARNDDKFHGMGLVHLYKHECGLLESTNLSLLNCLSFFCMYFAVIFVVLFVLVNECSSERFMCELNTQGLMGLREKKFLCVNDFYFIQE